jgi:hypothetical protein
VEPRSAGPVGVGQRLSPTAEIAAGASFNSGLGSAVAIHASPQLDASHDELLDKPVPTHYFSSSRPQRYRVPAWIKRAKPNSYINQSWLAMVKHGTRTIFSAMPNKLSKYFKIYSMPSKLKTNFTGILWPFVKLNQVAIGLMH